MGIQVYTGEGKTFVEVDKKLALAMSAGARALEDKRQKGYTAYIYDMTHNPQEITYDDAIELLLRTSYGVLNN